MANHVIYVRAQAFGQAALSSVYPPKHAFRQLPDHLVTLRHVILSVIAGGRRDLLELYGKQLSDPSRPKLP
jgi:hypothetical protein